MKPIQLESATIRRLVIMVYDRLTSPTVRQQLAEQLAPLLHVRSDRIENSPEVFAEIACFKLVLECLVLQSTLPQEQLCDPEWGIELSHRCYQAFAEYYTRRSRQSDRMLDEETPRRLYDHIRTYEKAVKTRGLAMAGSIFSQRVLDHFGQGQSTYSGGKSTILTLILSSSILTNYWPEQFDEFDIAPDAAPAAPVPVVDRREIPRRRMEDTSPCVVQPMVGTACSRGKERGETGVMSFLQMSVDRFFDAIAHIAVRKSDTNDDVAEEAAGQQWVESYDPLEDYQSHEIDEEFHASGRVFGEAVGARN